MKRFPVLMAITVTVMFVLSPCFGGDGAALEVHDGDNIKVSWNGNGITTSPLRLDYPEITRKCEDDSNQFTKDLVLWESATIYPVIKDSHGQTVDWASDWYYEHTPWEKYLNLLQEKTKSAKVGFWVDSDVQSQRSFRIAQASGAVAQSNLQPSVYHGNVKSKVFHRTGCQHYNCKNCISTFRAPDEAIKAGYRPCKLCNP